MLPRSKVFSELGNLILFLLLEGISFYLIITYNDAQAKIYQNSVNVISGSIANKASNILGYFSLNEQNSILLKENAKLKNGICWCDKPCSGQGDGKTLGNCKRITIAIFQTGSVIITGARNQSQLDESYEFINKVLKQHAFETLKPISA